MDFPQKFTLLRKTFYSLWNLTKTVLFQGLRQLREQNPETSYQIYFQGDPDYTKYWNEVEKHPDKHTALDIWDGLERISDGQTILHTPHSFLTGAKVTNPKAVPPIKTFGATRIRYNNIIFTENSPLVPLFAKAASKTFENGLYDRISMQWRGGNVVQEAKSWTMLSHGQVAFNFMTLMCLIGYSLVILILECFYFYQLKQRMLSPIIDQWNVIGLTKKENDEGRPGGNGDT